MEVIVKFKIHSENIDRNGRKLVLKVRLENSIVEPEIRIHEEKMVGIARVEYYELVADQSTKHIDRYFNVKRNIFSMYELIVQTNNEKDSLIMNIPEIIGK